MLQRTLYPKPGDIPTLNRKIFRGQRVSILEHPYMASIRRLLSQYSTGVLTTKNVVITVAHPLINVPVPHLNVILGENYSDRGTLPYTVILVIVHQKYNHYTLQNDIAMLRLYEPITYNVNIKSILMTAGIDVLDGEKAFVTGWGRCDNMGTELCLNRTTKFYPDEKIDPMLRTISFVIKNPNYYCDQYKYHDVPLRPGMLCAGVAREEDQVAPCLAVPGAPLVVKAKVAGLLSWGFGCGYSYDMPLVYTQMSYFLPWVIHNNKILFNVKHEALTTLFEATKSAVISQWLTESRNITPHLFIRRDRAVQPLPVDHQLAKLRGTVYDVRDSILDGRFMEEKKMLYDTLSKEEMREETISVMKAKAMEATHGRPFINKDALDEVE